MVRILRSGAVVAMLVGLAITAQAAGLGRLTVNSALGQVLNAEIDLVSMQPGEADSLTARVASPEAFRDARIEYTSSLRLLRFAVDKRASGQPYIKVTSVAPINEPFVDALIEITWPSGRIQREYPILLDPPGYTQRTAPPAVTAARPAETPPAAAPAAAPPPPAATTGSPSAQAEMPATASVEVVSSDTYGPVQKGETLRKIAAEVKPSSVSMEQMLVALYRENKAAFIGNNMNRLKTGQILKVPSAEEASQIASPEANKEIRTHVADWKGYREQLASGVASLPSRPESRSAASGRVASAAVAPPAPPPAESRDVLKLSKSDAGKAAPSTKAGGAGQVSALQEELIAKDKALKEAQSRVTDLEKQIRDMQRLLDLKAGVAAKGAESVAAAPKAEPAKPAQAPKVAEVKPTEAPKAPTEAAKPAEAPKIAEAPKAAEASKPPEAPKAEAAKTAEAPKPTEPPKTTEAPKQAAPKAAAPKKAPPPPPPSFADELLDNWPYLAAGGVALAGIIGGFLFVRRRRARAEAGPMSAMTSAFPSDLKPNTTTGKPGGGLVDTGNSSFLTDFDKTGPGAIDTDEVDPVAEAEVYIAYGRDAQAEEILKEAMSRDKNRHEIPLKLLEIYHARKSATAFETVAKELHASVGEASPVWQKAAAMGAQIDPTNPLYAAAASGTATFAAVAPAAAPPKPDLDFDIAGSSAGAGEAQAAPAPDFNLDTTSAAPAPDLAADASPSIDFDLAPSHAAAPAADVPAEAPKEEKPAFDFDLSGLDFGSKAAEPAPAPAPAFAAAPASSSPPLDLADLSLETPASSGAGGGGGEGVETTLELAKAYLGIGDKDGARENLQEVIKKGTPAQQEEAKKLIDSL